MNHTPGPWTADSEGYIYGSAADLEIARAFCHDRTFDGHEDAAELARQQATCAANKALILAAPDLLTACKCALALLKKRDQGGIIEGVAIGALTNALAKAEAAR